MLELRKFILAGAATFTATAPNGDHYTYRVNRAKPKHGQKEADQIWFVNLGVSYESQIYMGILKGEQPQGLILTKGSRVSESAPSYVVFQALWWDALHETNANDDEPGRIITGSGIRFQHEGRCCVCSRPLTNPVSIDMGIGPECSGRMEG